MQKKKSYLDLLMEHTSSVTIKWITKGPMNEKKALQEFVIAIIIEAYRGDKSIWFTFGPPLPALKPTPTITNMSIDHALASCGIKLKIDKAVDATVQAGKKYITLKLKFMYIHNLDFP